MNTSSGPTNSDNSQIEAIEFDAPSGPRNTVVDKGSYASSSQLGGRADGPWWHSQFNLMLAVFGLLAFAVMLFILLAPPPSVKSLDATVVSADGSKNSASATTQQAPWDEGRRAQARSDSQEILAELLESKKALESKNVTQWAAERYQAAIDKAELGDEFYKQQDFGAAIENYQAALVSMEKLNEMIPQVLAGIVKEGLSAIDDGKAALAKEKFTQALTLDRNNIPAMQGLGRAKTLDQVLDVLRSAKADEQIFVDSDELNALQSAQQKYQQILTIDSGLTKARDGLKRVDELISDKRYRQFMSQGFNALFNGRHGSAKAAFASALKIKPDDQVASSAYRQSIASDSRSTLGALLASARSFEKSEQWSNSITNYKAALQRDPNQVNARLGLIRSQVRGQLDTRLIEIIKDPLALSKRSQQDAAVKVLNDAKAIAKKGPRLKQQISQIEEALQQLDNTVKVSFVSNALTDVSLIKEGSKRVKLGKFSIKNFALKPGRYVLEGVRLGFKDVRQELVIRLGASEIQSFSISCAEPVSGAPQLSRVSN